MSEWTKAEIDLVIFLAHGREAKLLKYLEQQLAEAKARATTFFEHGERLGKELDNAEAKLEEAEQEIERLRKRVEKAVQDFDYTAPEIAVRLLKAALKEE